jgi:hypothetical protein
MADNNSLTDEDLRALGIEVDESSPNPAPGPQTAGLDKNLSQADIDALVAAMGK